jgi:hypothetical protein
MAQFFRVFSHPFEQTSGTPPGVLKFKERPPWANHLASAPHAASTATTGRNLRRPDHQLDERLICADDDSSAPR